MNEETLDLERTTEPASVEAHAQIIKDFINEGYR
jgi:hypothetical protein